MNFRQLMQGDFVTWSKKWQSAALHCVQLWPKLMSRLAHDMTFEPCLTKTTLVSTVIEPEVSKVVQIRPKPVCRIDLNPL